MNGIMLECNNHYHIKSLEIFTHLIIYSSTHYGSGFATLGNWKQ